MTRTRYEISNLESREMSALARLRSLTDLDLDEICRVEQVNIDAETCRRDLLAAKFLVAPEHVGYLTTLAVHGHYPELLRALGVCPERSLTLRTKRHGGKENRSVVSSDLGVCKVAADDRPLLQIKKMPQGHGLRLFNFEELANEILVAFLASCNLAGRAPDIGLAAIFTHQTRRPGKPGWSPFRLRETRCQSRSQLRIQFCERESGALGAAIVLDPEKISQLRREPDRSKEPAIAVDFVNAHSRHDLLDSRVLHDEAVAQCLLSLLDSRRIPQRHLIHRIWVDRIRAAPEGETDVMKISKLTGLENHAALTSQCFRLGIECPAPIAIGLGAAIEADFGGYRATRDRKVDRSIERLIDCRKGKMGIDKQLLLGECPRIIKNEQCRALIDGRSRLQLDPLERLNQRFALLIENFDCPRRQPPRHSFERTCGLKRSPKHGLCREWIGIGLIGRYEALAELAGEVLDETGVELFCNLSMNAGYSLAIADTSTQK